VVTTELPRPPNEGADSSCPTWFEHALAVPCKQWDVDVEGSPVRALAWGDEGRPGVVLAHGFMAHAHCLSFIAALLSEHFRVVAYDLSGMGDSPMHPRFDDLLRGRELTAVARDAGLFESGRKPYLIAHSQGGHSAMAAIEADSEAFAGLVVCDMMMIRPSMAERFFARRRGKPWPPREARPHAVHPDPETILGRYKLAPPQPCENTYLLDFVARHSVKTVEGGYTWKFDPEIRISDGHPPEWWLAQPQRFADIDIARKAIVHGEKSAAFGADSAAYLRELTQGTVPIVAVPEAHHHLMLDQPLAFTSALRAILELWLADAPGTGP
jgi:pimeloyl-ACP methyl ester carboxylesterase